MAGVELATQLPQPQGTVLYDPNGLVYVPNSVFPYSGYPINNAVHEPARIVLVDEPTERTESQNTAKANDDNGKSTSPVTGVVTSTSGTSIIGSPADGVIGSDGQVLGSVQDTAAVESAGNLGPTLLQAQVPMPYLSGPQIYSSGQVAFAPGMRYPQSYVMDKGVTYRVSMDQYGQPLFTQITQDQNQRS
ncbi:unnamed protein product [Dicrocoelium dendriticum]|nr:unnamed protein product [Dicrocoelium dendriticum]